MFPENKPLMYRMQSCAKINILSFEDTQSGKEFLFRLQKTDEYITIYRNDINNALKNITDMDMYLKRQAWLDQEILKCQHVKNVLQYEFDFQKAYYEYENFGIFFQNQEHCRIYNAIFKKAYDVYTNSTDSTSMLR